MNLKLDVSLNMDFKTKKIMTAITAETNSKKTKKCEFDKNGFCEAFVCYSKFKCEARDKNGNPKYK